MIQLEWVHNLTQVHIYARRAPEGACPVVYPWPREGGWDLLRMYNRYSTLICAKGCAWWGITRHHNPRPHSEFESTAYADYVLVMWFDNEDTARAAWAMGYEPVAPDDLSLIQTRG